MSSSKAYLIVLDGFGLSEETHGNAIAQADTPFLDSLFTNNPLSKLKTDGESVGLPDFQTGGSEVGHITMSSGRQNDQLLKKINDAVEQNTITANPVMAPILERAKKNQRIHLIGLCSDGGVHSYLPHLLKLQLIAKDHGIDNIFVHALLDGRDVAERSAEQYLSQIENQQGGEIASIGGRFYGMDRDTNWDRTQAAYDTLCNSSIGIEQKDWRSYLNNYYQTSDKSDYYVPPALFIEDGRIQSDDIVVFFNFRTDRARQLTIALIDPEFSEFETPCKVAPDNFVIFGPYSELAQQPFLHNDSIIPETIGEIVARHNQPQLRISETEKFNHVTFFFSGQQQDEFPGEKRILIPSPKCPSYAERPEMSAVEQTDAAIQAIDEQDFQLVVQNFANADLVGHSADMVATKTAIETIDLCLGRLLPAARQEGYEVFITADHGNAEQMITQSGEPNAAHSKNLVPFCWFEGKKTLRERGELSDVAPTILEVLGYEKPDVMTGESLITS